MNEIFYVLNVLAVTASPHTCNLERFNFCLNGYLHNFNTTLNGEFYGQARREFVRQNGFEGHAEVSNWFHEFKKCLGRSAENYLDHYTGLELPYSSAVAVDRFLCGVGYGSYERWFHCLNPLLNEPSAFDRCDESDKSASDACKVQIVEKKCSKEAADWYGKVLKIQGNAVLKTI